MCNHESCHAVIKQRWDAKSSGYPEAHFRHQRGSVCPSADAIINFLFYLLFSQSVTKTTANMCCKGFLKIMMFLFNGGIFVSTNRSKNCLWMSVAKTNFKNAFICISTLVCFRGCFFNRLSLSSCKYPTMGRVFVSPFWEPEVPAECEPRALCNRPAKNSTELKSIFTCMFVVFVHSFSIVFNIVLDVTNPGIFINF